MDLALPKPEEGLYECPVCERDIPQPDFCEFCGWNGALDKEEFYGIYATAIAEAYSK